jgi:hypothetical protein
MELRKDSETIVIIAVVAVMLIVIYKVFGGLKNVFDGVNNALGGGKEGADVDKSVKNRDTTPKPQDPWSPEYTLSRLAAGKKVSLLKGATKISLINKILDDTAWAQWFENGGKLVSIFKTIGHKSQISDLAKAWQDKEGTDMLTVIKDRMQRNLGGWLSNTDVNKNLNDLLAYVSGLPE